MNKGFGLSSGSWLSSSLSSEGIDKVYSYRMSKNIEYRILKYYSDNGHIYRVALLVTDNKYYNYQYNQPVYNSDIFRIEFLSKPEAKRHIAAHYNRFFYSKYITDNL